MARHASYGAKRHFIRTGTFYVYIVRCCDGTLYTGFTPRLKNRIQLHNAGRGAKYTRQRRPVQHAWHRKYRYFKHAFLAERRIKRFTRAQKEALIRFGRMPRRKPRVGRK